LDHRSANITHHGHFRLRNFFSKSAETNASSIEANAQKLLNDFTKRCAMARKEFTDFEIHPPSTLAEMLSRAERQVKVNQGISKREGELQNE
jgi:hypothetical protein